VTYLFDLFCLRLRLSHGSEFAKQKRTYNTLCTTVEHGLQCGAESSATSHSGYEREHRKVR
jgi:hypothetical protein